MKTRITRNYVPTRKEQVLTLISGIRNSFWRTLGSLFKKDFINNPALRKRISAQLVLVLFASTLVAVFVQAPSSNAVVVQDCSAIGQLRNGGFEAPVAGTTVISSAGATYPAETLTAAQQNSTNSVTNAVYGSVADTFWNHLDASADASTYRTFRLPGRAGDARVYWNTTEASEQLELGSFVTPQAGSRFAELNSAVQAALYQDIPTIPGVTIRWSLAHRGRDGTDTMRVYIGKPTNTAAQVRASAARFNNSAWSNNTTLQNNSATRTNSARAGLSLASARAAGSTTLQTDISDGQTWRFWYGTYEETSTTTTNTRFMFESVSPTGGSGNLLDSITFAPVAACPITRLYNSPTDTQTVNIFDTNAGSFAMVPDESGHQESVTALTHVSGPGSAFLNSGNRSLTFTPNGSGVTTFDYTIRYVANGIESTSDGRITITARDIFGSASCSPGTVETATSTVNGQITVVETFRTPPQANTDDDADHRSATCTWTAPEGVFGVDYLVVGGGGGGSSGGGGGGGVVTSWSTAMASDTSTERTALRNPLAVTPGETVNITVGGGGKRGWGGSARCTFGNSVLASNGTTADSNCGGFFGGTNSTSTTRIATNGADSVFGSIRAIGGGAGGRYTWPEDANIQGGESGGSSGGNAADYASTVSVQPVASQVVGAASFGNRGGISTGAPYAAGAGGGGAGTNAEVTDNNSAADNRGTNATATTGNGGVGGNQRRLFSNGDGGAGAVTNPPAGCTSTSQQYSGNVHPATAINNCFTRGAGGNGGRGVASNIASFTNVFAEYGCGGGGGINDNSAADFSGRNGGGLAGCPTAGRGSSWGSFLTTTVNRFRTIVSQQYNGTEVPTESFGGGGGGTDPEADRAGAGGSGVVIIRYVVSNIACPNSANATNVVGPIACPYPITITAGAAVATQYNLSHGTAALGFVSFPGASTDTVTVTSTIGNGIDTVTTTVNGNLASFAVSNANTALAGATYPLRYTIFSDSLTSTSFVLLRIVDPSQATPVIIPVDPRVTEIDLPALRIGGSQMTQVCFTPIDDNETSGYSNIPSVDRTTNRTTETRTVTAAIGRLRLQGTSANLQQAVQFIRVTKHASDDLLIPGSVPRRIRVNVSNGTVGGNGSCTFGNESIIELRPMLPEQTIRQGEVKLKNTP
jgi:hypothetical protein